MTLTPTLEWNCDRCQKPIGDGDGVFWASINTADAHGRYMTDLRGRLDSTVADLLDAPPAATWQWAHHACRSIDTQLYSDDGRVYAIAVEEMRTYERLLWWAGHLTEKPWVKNSNLSDLLQQWGSHTPTAAEVSPVPPRPHLVILCPDETTRAAVAVMYSAPSVVILVADEPAPLMRRWPDNGITLTHRDDGRFNISQWRGELNGYQWPAVIDIPGCVKQ